MGLKAHAGNEAARNGQRLLVAIGGHSGWRQKDRRRSISAPTPHFDENDSRWTGTTISSSGKQNQFAGGKPVRIFVMGENKWRDEDAWPLERAKPTQLLSSLGRQGQQRLRRWRAFHLSRLTSEAADSFVYDPANPVPTVGGPLCCDPMHLAPGPRDQKEVEARPDVLVYSTPPLDSDLEVTGPDNSRLIRQVFRRRHGLHRQAGRRLAQWLRAESDGRNSCARVIRESTTARAKPIVPGKVYEYKIDLWSTSNVFLKGHRIRLEVSSSNFPRFDRNLNTGKPASTSAIFVKATNTILHDAAHPSALLLPVVPR